MSQARRWRLSQLTAQRRDAVGTAALTVVVTASVVGHAYGTGQPITLLIALAAVPSILLRRSRPWFALVLAVAAAAVVPNNRAMILPVMLVLYTIASHAPWKTGAAAAAGAALIVIGAGVAWGSDATSARGGLYGYAIGSGACCAVAVALGLYVAARRRVLEGLRERAERLDRERELLADRAVAQERVRIAQELHDVVAHNVSLMVVKAQALGATAGEEGVRSGTDAIADLGRQAMAEMHATLRLLRSENGDGPELAPQPGLGQLERLIEQSRGAGLDIELTVEGQPRELAQGIDLSAFRILQEALTNVVKHAAGATTKVTLAYGERGVELTIVDRAQDGPARARTEPSDGHGLIGMRERAAMFGGTLSAEALPDGYRVSAKLPYAPTAS